MASSGKEFFINPAFFNIAEGDSGLPGKCQCCSGKIEGVVSIKKAPDSQAIRQVGMINAISSSMTRLIKRALEARMASASRWISRPKLSPIKLIRSEKINIQAVRSGR
mgnify:CR=1 FL=1